MAFDIHQRVFDAYGEYLEEAAIRYRDALMNLFAASAEGQEVERQRGAVGWAATFMDYGIDYLGVTPPAMTLAHAQEILFDLFPRKVAAAPGSGEEIIDELRAFWTFMQREFGLANADAFLRIMTPATARRLDKEMQNPANFGMAKSFMTLGRARGFDMTTPESLQAWTETYNAELRGDVEPPLSLPGARSSYAAKTDKARRKMAQDSRRKNRKKK